MKPKLSKAERKIKLLEQVLQRREREINRLNKEHAEQVNRIQRKNEFTKFQIASIKKGEWPL